MHGGPSFFFKNLLHCPGNMPIIGSEMATKRDIKKLQRLRAQAVKAAGVTARAAAAERRLREQIGDELRQQRERRDISLRYMAHRMGVAPSTLSRIERGSLPLRTTDVEAIAEVWAEKSFLNVETKRRMTAAAT